MNAGRISRWALARRAATVLGVVVAHTARLGLAIVRRPGRAHRDELVAAAVLDALQRLGPTYVKFGQVLSTRADLIPPAACRVLGRLFDRVRTPEPAAVLRAVPTRVRDAVRGGTAGMRMVAAGSIACVYHATLADGTPVAVKVRRPGIERVMALDLALMRALTRLACRLPALRGAPVVEIVTQVGDCVGDQLDFTREAGALRLLRENLAVLPEVRVPAVVESLSGPAVLVTEWMAGLERGAGATAGRRDAVVHGLRAAYQMLFRDGFVHCDLHPGNLYLMPDGTAVILDAGFTRRLAPVARRAFSEFFYYMGRNDGPRCAEILLSTALAGDDRADTAGFRDDVVALVAAGSGVPARDFDLVRFAFRLFAIQRARGFYADPEFIFPILALVVLEGTVREIAPDLDFQAEAVPYVLRGLADTASVRRTG